MIDIKDFFRISINNLKNRKKRTFLTMLGVVIGIAAVVALVSIGLGLSNSINNELEKLGTDKLFITAKTAGGAAVTGNDAQGKITATDLNLVRKISGVKEATGLLAQATKARFGKQERTLYLFSYPKKTEEAKLIDEVNTWKISKGRMLNPGEKGKAVIGSDIANKLYDKKIEIGNKIICDGKTYKVIGIFKKIGDPGLDKGILVGEDELREQYNKKNLLSYIYVKTESGENAEEVAEKIKKAMRKKRGLKEGQEDFSVETPLQMIEMFSIVLNIVTIVLIGIAAISLLVGGIGIMNTMYTSVLQRTKEIGTMKAIGAKNKDIMLLFLIESGIIGIIGGLIGIIIGFIISKSVEIIAAQAMGINMLKIFFPWYLILGALLFSFLVGTLSGILPARRASKLKPVDALRYE